MSNALALDRSRVCTYTFNNGCQCRIPLSPRHTYLCTFHARKESHVRASEKVGREIAFDLSSDYISFCDVSSALAHTITAVAQRPITARTASTIAYLTQNLVQSVAGAEKEYIGTFGTQAWREKVAANFNSPRPDDNPRDNPSNDPEDPPHQISNRSQQAPAEDVAENDAEHDPASAGVSTMAGNSRGDAQVNSQNHMEDDAESVLSATTAPASPSKDLGPNTNFPSQPQVEAALARLRVAVETQ